MINNREAVRSQPIDDQEVQDMPSLDRRAIARRLGCGVDHVDALWDSGDLPSIDVGAAGSTRRMLRTTPNELKQFIADRRDERS